MKTVFIRFNGKDKTQVGSITLVNNKLQADGFGQQVLTKDRPNFKGNDTAFLQNLENVYRPPYLYASFSAK